MLRWENKSRTHTLLMMVGLWTTTFFQIKGIIDYVRIMGHYHPGAVRCLTWTLTLPVLWPVININQQSWIISQLWLLSTVLSLLNFAGIEPPPALLLLRNRSYSCVYTNLKYKYLIWVSSPRVDLWISDCPFLSAAYCELYFMRVNHVENPLKYCGLIKSPRIVSDLSSKSTFLELTPYWKYYWG